MSAATKRYADALFSSATKAAELDAVGSDLQGLLDLFATSPDFKAFVEHPLISPEKQSSCLDKLFKGKLSDVTLNFLQLLVQRERLGELKGILQTALEGWREVKGILPVEVVSAQPLSKEQESELSHRLHQRTGKTIELSQETDPDLIGGFRLHYQGIVEDYSIAAKLQTFKRNVLNA